MFPRDEVHLSINYFLIVLADPDCAGGGLGHARAVSRRGLLYSHCFNDLMVCDRLGILLFYSLVCGTTTLRSTSRYTEFCCCCVCCYSAVAAAVHHRTPATEVSFTQQYVPSIFYFTTKRTNYSLVHFFFTVSFAAQLPCDSRVCIQSAAAAAVCVAVLLWLLLFITVHPPPEVLFTQQYVPSIFFCYEQTYQLQFSTPLGSTVTFVRPRLT